MLPVRRWALLSSGCAPVLLIAGWAVAAILEGPSYDPTSETISVLGAYGASGYWIMTGAFLALGLCHVLTALALRAAALPGRLALAGGGASAVAVVLVPTPSSGGSLSHGAVAAAGFTLMAVWPVLAATSEREAPWALRPIPSRVASAAMVLSAAWFVYELDRQGAPGTAERVVTALQSLWPFVVVVSCLRHDGEVRAMPS
ncbi:DUF998 domain-containing protein [Streptomyces sp. HSG2]|uniref:DUF998 domain-containing protein n=1 Tax=Streptomyces sp. HSG2 TaxID=2797167 RepID=UPI0019070CDD|nr:DUF998 domain-containing protein [Streptomyces sp. HSG2]